MVSSWAYNDTVPGPIMRANDGDQVELKVRNMCHDPTSLHSHGAAMRNHMDGVQPASDDIVSTAQHIYSYSYTVPHSGPRRHATRLQAVSASSWRSPGANAGSSPAGGTAGRIPDIATQSESSACSAVGSS